MKKPASNKYMTKRQVAALLYAARGCRWKSAFDCFLLMYVLGLRVSEAALLEWRHLDSRLIDDQGVVRGIRVPTLKKRVWPPPLKTVPVLAHFKWVARAFDPSRHGRKPDSPFLFPSRAAKDRPITRYTIDKWFGWCCKAAGLPSYYSTHALRHTAATQLYRSLKDIVLVNKFLRHTNVNSFQTDPGSRTTGQYIHIDISDYRPAINDGALRLPRLSPLPLSDAERESVMRMD